MSLIVPKTDIDLYNYVKDSIEIFDTLEDKELLQIATMIMNFKTDKKMNVLYEEENTGNVIETILFYRKCLMVFEHFADLMGIKYLKQLTK